MSRVLFSVWFSIQGIIQNTTCSVWFRIQRIIKKYPGYYSASGSLFRVLFNKRPAASGSGFSVLLKNIQGIIQHLVQNTAYYSKYDVQRLVHYSGYYTKYDLQRLVQNSGYYQKMSRVLFSVWFIIQGIQYSEYYSKYDLQRLVQDSAYYSKYPGYYSASGSLFRVLFKIRHAASGSLLFKIRSAASGSGFRVLSKTVQGIIQRMVQYSAYYSKYDLQRLVQDSAYY